MYISAKYALLYLGVEIAVYLGLKVLRKDYTHWLPIKGLFSLVVSGIVRVVVKMIEDFTDCMHYRHPYEVGGLYFTVNLFVPVFGLLAVLYFTEGTLSPTTLSYMKNLAQVL
ncbi:hypothetical protein TrLO_g4240 [Triparma laevis f. longispina]|uniref:Uncharacterized protein n=1 Tax=Triparma laevis f. longispina TaxID=1714387 RepID=A0A9W7ED94_9STRA|nr:hypothetical protein TrLO_g4240 [Triparma laevis f. longispina]